MEVKAWEDEQIQEAYSNFSKQAKLDYVHLKNPTACDTFIETGKAKRNKAKAVSKEIGIKLK